MKKTILLAFAVLLAVTGIAVFATPAPLPAWWNGTDTVTGNATLFIDGNFTGNATITDYSPANLGQLKNVAKQAKIYLDAILADEGRSGPYITAMVNDFSNTTTDYSPVNLGQLKAVAKPFYDRLIAVGYNTNANLIARGYAGNWTSSYPWDPGTNTTVNYSPANLGQVKMVFSFDLSSGNLTLSNTTITFDENFQGISGGCAGNTDGDDNNNGSDILPLDPGFFALPSISSNNTTYPAITLTAPNSALMLSTQQFP